MRGLVLIVDDHPLVGEALEVSIRRRYPDLDVGRVTSAAEAEAFARRHVDRLRLILLDLMLPDADGFSALLRLQQIAPAGRIAIVSARTDAHTVSMARAFGVNGYLSKAQDVETLVNAVGALLNGEALFPTDAVADPAVVDFHRRLATLSPAQLRVLRTLSEGISNKEIAADMHLTEGTVKQHVSAIFKKLGVSNRSQAILAASSVLAHLLPPLG